MTALTDELRGFVLTLPSVPFLEALLLVHGTPDQIWTAEALAQRLYLQSVCRADAIVQELAERGFCACTAAGQLVYSPRDARLHGLVLQLAGVYHQKLVEITGLVHR
ncbi:hypothetical protein IP91_01800 [Pseudoduganella lurida]|uniref:MarR family transcriptional regulator n=1 Tax=Pseudoduganella lurida TaxID=1036180 RepID=A0A562RFM0_9BURK|nr:hypothetical protein [Pseudoduganella lurida]TWI67683.1 hypothetical protein IP91_01800 [Pseudoduganella lurida]